MFPYDDICRFVKKYHTDNDNIDEKIMNLENAIRDGGFYGEDGVWNSILTFAGDNHIYRGRVETLIIKDGKYLYLKKMPSSELYVVPGGSFEKDLPNVEQAINECREEAFINVVNVRSTGITYKEYKEPSKKKLHSLVNWNARYTEVYVAEFDSWFHGHVDDVDRDYFIASGEFYLIEDVYNILRKEHRDALNAVMGDVVNLKKESTTTFDHHREKVMLKVLRKLRELGVKVKINPDDKRKFLNGEKSSVTGNDSLCISGIGEKEMPVVIRILNTTIRKYGARVSADNYGTIFLSVKKNDVLNEAALTAKERKNIPSNQFGIPSQRRFPLHDEDHVRAAIRLFNKVDKKHEKELAYNIVKRMKRYGLSPDMIGRNNRLYNYLYYFDDQSA